MSDAASTSGAGALPPWAVVSPRRREHVARVTGLLMRWAAELSLAPAEAAAWRDAGLLHDALRDLDEPELRRLAADETSDVNVLHGPAAAARLVAEGESRADVLDAVRHHTLGSATWGRVGRALYMADYLEPGRKFAQADRAFLVAHAPHDFDGVFRQVVRQRLEWTLREGKGLHASTVAMWNAVR
jgi:2-amino-4-hydroxy-6-hydroxymethyldihydropteridine diphosphokinase